jgi:PTH1 family peptidyl-tRNA hydrolase
VARQALEAADHVVFVGVNALKGLQARRHADDDAVHAVPTVDAARRHLERILVPGDLVLLKGSRADHLESLVHARVAAPGAHANAERGPASAPAGPPVRAIVGLGNPGQQHEHTPHNVGQRALDLVAGSLGATFAPDDEAMVARVEQPAGTCYLVKPLTKVNVTGPVLRRLAQRLGFTAKTCILLHDDIDLPLGAVRVRMSGGDGGHRGVRSVLDAFDSFDVPRVKIGVGRPARGDNAARHVVGAFDPTDLATIDTACAEAASRAVDLAAPAPRGRRAVSTPEASSGSPRG